MKLYYGRITDSHGNVEEVLAQNTGDIVHIDRVLDEGGRISVFESDFRHVASWAEERGYEWEEHEFEVTLEGMLMAFGPTSPAPPTPLFGVWTSVEDALPEIPPDDRYERIYVRVLATLDNGNVREVGFVKSREESVGRWLEVNGRPISGRVSHWTGMPPAAAEQGGRS